MVNSLGFRNYEFDIEKLPNIKRIVFIGGSTTFGVDGRVEDTFPFQVGELLQKQLPETSIETINAAMPSKTSFWELERMKEILYLKPDLVIVMTGYNDSASVYTPLEKIGKDGEIVFRPWGLRLDRFLSKHSVFYVTLREKISILLYGVPDYAFSRPRAAQEDTKIDPSEWFAKYPENYFGKNILGMIQTAKQNGIKLVFIKAPLSIQRKTARPLYEQAYARLMEELEKLSEENKIPLIDLTEVFEPSEERKDYSNDGLHFSLAGNRKLAESITEFLIQHPELLKQN